MAPTFSICIPAHEDEQALVRALSHLRSQTFRDWECLIADDSTSDRIRDAVARIGDERLHYLRNTPARGVPQNWNFVLSRARGTYVTLLHQDDFYGSDTLLETVFRALDKSGAQLGVCAFSTWENNQRVALHDKNQRPVASFLEDFPQRSLVVNRVGHPSVLFLANALKDTEFDTSLRYFLDTDWYARLWRKATPVYIREAEVCIEVNRASQLSTKCREDFLSTTRELERALEKWQASPTQVAASFSRLFISHIRYANVTGKIFLQYFRHWTLWQKTVSLGLSFALFWHMLYRYARRKLGYRWG